MLKEIRIDVLIYFCPKIGSIKYKIANVYILKFEIKVSKKLSERGGGHVRRETTLKILVMRKRSHVGV